MNDLIERLEDVRARHVRIIDMENKTAKDPTKLDRAEDTIDVLDEAAQALKAQADEIARLKEAIDYYEIGVTAVGVPHDAERKILHDCVAKARDLRALKTSGGQ